MRRAVSILVLVLILILPIIGKASAGIKNPEAEFDAGGIQLKVNETAYYSLTVRNNLLNEEDNLTLRASTDSQQLGCKIEERDVPAGKIECQSNHRICRVPIKGDSELDVRFQLAGRSSGETVLYFRVRSEITGLTDKERITVALSGGNIGHTAPAMSISEILLLSVVGSAIYGLFLIKN